MTINTEVMIVISFDSDVLQNLHFFFYKRQLSFQILKLYNLSFFTILSDLLSLLYIHVLVTK